MDRSISFHETKKKKQGVKSLLKPNTLFLMCEYVIDIFFYLRIACFYLRIAWKQRLLTVKSCTPSI